MGAATPSLPVVQTVAVGVGGIRRAVGGQAILLEPADEHAADSRLKFIGPNIDGATGDARAAVEVCAAGYESIIAGIDAWRVGFQPQISASQVHEHRRIVDIPEAARVWRCATVLRGTPISNPPKPPSFHPQA